MKNRSSRPHRKKSLPVPGDVFISQNGAMRIITMDGWDYVGPKWSDNNGVYDFVNGTEIDDGFRWRFFGIVPNHFIVNYYHYGFYFLGNALTDEWENG